MKAPRINPAQVHHIFRLLTPSVLFSHFLISFRPPHLQASTLCHLFMPDYRFFLLFSQLTFRLHHPKPSIHSTLDTSTAREKECSSMFKPHDACFTLRPQATPPHTNPASHPTSPDTSERLGAVRGTPDESDGRVRRVLSCRTSPAPILAL